jgi:seryl-tRNA synthetase
VTEEQATQTQAVEGSEDQASTGSNDEQRGEDTSQEGASADTSQGDGSESESADLVPKSELTKRNKENQTLRGKLRKYEQDEEKRRKEQLSETESLREENEGLKSTNESLTNQVKRYNFERSLNLPDADLAWGMLSDLGLEVEWGDSYQVSNIDEIRKVLKREKPRIWGSGSANGGERAEEVPTVSGSGFVNDLFRSGRQAQGRRRR